MDVEEYLGEGIHTAFRKALPDSKQAHQIWKLIREMPDEDWEAIVKFVAIGLKPLCDEVERLRELLRDARHTMFSVEDPYYIGCGLASCVNRIDEGFAELEEKVND